MYEVLRLAIIVPVFNEGLRIESVLKELLIEFDEILTSLIIVDDCSTDDTSNVLSVFMESNDKCKVFRNSSNLGHGPSVMEGLRIASEGTSTHVLTYDGDGYLRCDDIMKGIRSANLNEKDTVLEMVRVHRQDPGYRKLITKSLRLFVVFFTSKKVSDPNTPSRVINKETLKAFLSATSATNPVPSLWFAIFARKNHYDIREFKVRVKVEPSLKIRNSWDSKLRMIPSRRFILFCFKAARFWTWKK
jgi:dolichol-phosphate mannosyltransferase